jgi:hypothetical protein
MRACDGQPQDAPPSADARVPQTVPSARVTALVTLVTTGISAVSPVRQADAIDRTAGSASLADLDEAIAANWDAVAATPPSHPPGPGA